MFKVLVKENSLTLLWQDRIIMDGIIPAVSFDDGTKSDLTIKSSQIRDGMDKQGEFKEFFIKYGNPDESLSFEANFKAYNDILLASVDMERKFTPFAQIQLLKSTGGVKLEIDQLGKVNGLMANYLFSRWWTRPYFSTNIAKLPEKTQSLLWNDGDTYYHLLPLCDDVYKTELAGNGKGMDVLISAYEGGYSSCKTFSFILGAGENPYELSHKTVSAGFDILQVTGQTREYRRYPEALDYLGWCSWDAFYHDVNSSGIISKADEFKKQELPVKWFMIDDGWSELKDGKLASIKEDQDKFPEGLSALVDRLKQEYGVRWVGVWQNFLGYWNGIHPESDIVKNLPESVFEVNNGSFIPAPDAGKGLKFWNLWHSYVKKQGIDFVKVDNQSSLVSFLKDNLAIGKAAKEAHTALEASLGINFDNCIINCMGMAAEQLWNRPISAVSRNSDDFYPRKEGSFKEHALQNAYNSFYHGNFIWGDWDMWWSRHENAVNNAVLRAVSGGPVYTSDSVGKTDPELLWPLILSDGRILRCDRPGLPTADCLTVNTNEEQLPLKIWNTYGNSGLIAAFNINIEGNTVHGSVSPADILEVKGDKFIIYDWFGKKSYIVGRYEKLEFKLENDGVALYIIVPAEGKYTPIGLVNKYVSPAAISDLQSFDGRLIVTLKEGGLFAFAGETAPGKVLVNGKEFNCRSEGGIYTVDCSEIKHTVYMEII